MRNDSFSIMPIWVRELNKQQWDSVYVNVPTEPVRGPRDDYLNTLYQEVQPGPDGNYLGNKYNESELDAIHAFAVARLTIDLWERSIRKTISWKWNTGKEKKVPLKIVITPEESGAQYNKTYKSIIFGLYENQKFNKTVKSLDVVAHETTHAVVDSLRPDVDWVHNIDASAVVEALADITPILLQLTNGSLLDRIRQNNLRRENALSEFAEGIVGKGRGIRSALDKEITNKQNPYSLAKPMVHSVYKKVVKEWEKNPSGNVGLLAWAEDLAQKTLCPILDLREISPENYLKQINW